MNHLHVPVIYQGIVITDLETGHFPSRRLRGAQEAGPELIDAAYTAFHNGLHAALYLSAGLSLAAGILAFVTLRSRPADAGA